MKRSTAVTIGTLLVWIFSQSQDACGEITRYPGILDYRDPEIPPLEEPIVDNFAGVGARAMGMGGAYAPVANDFSAVYWNPAGLAQVRKVGIYGGLLPYCKKETGSIFNKETAATGELTKTWLASIGIAVPIPTYQGSLVFALGFNRIKDFSLNYNVTGYNPTLEFQQDEKVAVEGGIGAWSVAGAIDLSGSVSVGAALNIWDGENDFSRQLILSDSKRVHGDSTFYGRFSYSDEYGGTNLKLATLIRGVRGFKFGITVASPVTYEVEKTWRDEYTDYVGDVADTTWPEEEYLYTYKVQSPWSFAFGGSWTCSNLVLAFGAHYTDWKQAQYKVTPTAYVSKEDFRLKYKDVWRLHFGGEVSVPHTEIRLRAGFYTDPVAYLGPRSGYGSAIRTTKQRKWLTLGAGTTVDKVFSIDAAWVHGTWEQTEGNLMQKHKADRLFVTATYRF